MRKILFVLVLLCVEKMAHAQTPRTPYIYSIKADSVKITNTCDTAELIIENHTQTVPGFLYNKGLGRTEFRRITQFDDTSVVVGGDTIHLGRGYKNFANADLTYDDNHLHKGAFHSMNLTDFSKIGFKTNNVDGTVSAALNMDPSKGSWIWNNTSDPDLIRNNTLNLNSGQIRGLVTSTTPYTSKVGQMWLNPGGFILNEYVTDLTTGNWKEVGLSTNVDDYDLLSLDLHSNGGTINLVSDNIENSTQTGIYLNKGESVITSCWNIGIGSHTTLVQSNDGFSFVRNNEEIGLNLGFKIPGLPISTNSQDSVLVISANDGQVKKQAQSALTPALAINTVDIVDITASVDALTKLPNLQSHPGHTVTLPPAASYTGKKIYIWNQNANSSSNSWTFASPVTLPDNTTSNVIPNKTTIELLSDGEVWIRWK
ncbi:MULTISPECIES: hypothetical protein [Niastella]|uniref:Uncharacterized protein n=1 Tax=Niastella soli TaxID=2821487 RepID=A0ABS3Z4C9_9BACT|nr:hypothetical protein [Niastella soli]MBO9204505.1 hypothetical protein [Niastella soli]